MMVISAILLTWGVYLSAAAPSPTLPQQCPWTPSTRFNPSQPACPLIVNDKTAAEYGAWAPWVVYPPHCVYPGEGTATGKYCVYTYLSSGEAGISLVATPEVASSVAGILSARPEPWGEPSSWQLYPGPRQRAYATTDIPNKAKGAVATKKIRTGEVIIREAPFVLGFTAGPDGIAREENPGLLQTAFEGLPAWQRERLGDMAVSTGGEWHEDAMRTNAFGVAVDGVEFSALFPEVARINHACRPNAFTRYSRSTLQMEIVAHQDIDPGEEITITYIPQNLYTKDRQKLLSRRGFTCTCPVCSDSSTTASSDANKARIQSILGTLRDLGSARTEDVLDGLWEEMLGILREEALWSQVAEFAALWADLYAAVGARGKAREMAGWALRERVFYNGEDSERVEKARAFVRKFEG